MKICKYCNNEADDLYITNSNCESKCELEICLDCVDLNENKCLNCYYNKSDNTIDKNKSISKNEIIKTENKISNNKITNKFCEKCNKEDNKLIEWTFENCNNKSSHNAYICKSCLESPLKKINSEDHCYYCSFKFLKDNEKIKQKFYNCNEKHEINICFYCNNFYKNLKVNCDICFKTKKERCYFCNIESLDNMNLTGYGCAREYIHNYRACIDCWDHMDNISNNFSCKICLNKNSKDIIFFNTSTTDISIYEGFIGLKIYSNELKNSFTFDYLNCNKCFKEIYKKFYIERNIAQFEDYNTLPGSSVCEVNIKNEITYILTGGFEFRENYFDSKEQIIFIKFEKFNKFQYYLNKIFKEVKLEESRYFHKSIYIKSKNIIVTLGGITFKEGLIKILDTIEILQLNDNYNSIINSKKIKTKMLKQRHSFTALEYKEKIIYFGGFNEEEKLETSMEVLDLEFETVSKLKFKQPLNYKFLGGSNLLKINEEEYLIFGGVDLEKGNKIITKMNIKDKIIKKEKLKLDQNIFNGFSFILKTQNNEENLIIISNKVDFDNKNNLLIQKGRLSDNVFKNEVLEDFFNEEQSLNRKEAIKMDSNTLNLISINEIKYNLKI